MSPLIRLLAALAFAPAALTAADVFGPPGLIDYQGRLIDANGRPFAMEQPANYKVQFRIYDALQGGTLVWAEEQIVTVSQGDFSVRLGEGSAIPAAGGTFEGTVSHAGAGLPAAFNGRERYLGITVIVPNQQSGEIAPRLAFLTSPFSFVAGRAQSADSVNQPATAPASSLNVKALSLANAVMNASGTITQSAQTVVVDAATQVVQASLPPGASAPNRQFLIMKKDASVNAVIVQPQAGGTLNGVANGKIHLKVLGEAVTVQNVGGDDWWVVSESRDRTPPGTILSFGGGTPPAGYLLCDGTHLRKADYPELVAALGTAWGQPTDNSLFRVPDLRGAFLRGRDGSRGLDEDRNSRTADFAGAATGDKVGSFQSDIFKSHSHGINDPGHGHSISDFSIGHRGAASGSSYSVYAPSFQDGTSTNYIYEGVAQSSFTGITIRAEGGAETRPENYSVNFIIKF